MPNVVVHEGGLISVPASLDRRRVVDQLVRYSAGSSFPCFRLKKGALYAAEVVGTVQVGALRISILPISAEGGQEHDKEFLLNLLRAAGYLGPNPLVLAASVRSTAMDPLEAMLVEVGSEMLDALRAGVPRRYHEVAETSQTIRGRIDFTLLGRRLLGADAALPIRFTPLAVSNELSRTIRWVAELLARMAGSPEARQVLGEVLRTLESVVGPAPTRSEIASIRLSRYERSWTRTIEIAALLAAGRFIDPTFSGRSDAFGMLFPLQHLFERALRRVLAEAGTRIGLTVEHRSKAVHMLRDAIGVGHLQIRPDFQIYRDGTRILIGDAKWKRLSNTRRAHGVEREDVYQMNAYLTRLEAEQAAMFMPKVGWMGLGWRRDFTIPSTNRCLSLVSVDIEGALSRIASNREAAILGIQQSLSEIVKPELDRRAAAAVDVSDPTAV